MGRAWIGNRLNVWLLTISLLSFFADPPEVSIQLGSKLNAVDIREGDDVYFECTIDAFPAAERISWKKDVSKPALLQQKSSNLCGIDENRLFLILIWGELEMRFFSSRKLNSRAAKESTGKENEWLGRFSSWSASFSPYIHRQLNRSEEPK